MVKYFLKRFGLMLITFVIIIFLFFLFIHLLPDFHKPPIMGDDANYWIQYIKEGRNKPIVVQFFIWVKNIIQTGDFGYSQTQRMDVSTILFSKIPTTIMFQLIPYIITVPLGILLGIIAALHKNKLADNVISIGIIVFISVPTFVVAVLAQLVFGWQLHWVDTPPFVATASEFAVDFWGGIKSYVLPSMVMILGGIVGWARNIRAELTEQLTQDYMLLARSKGLSKRQATFRHALKNALVPFAPSIFLGFLGLLSGSIILETIFRVDGAGKIYLYAFNNRDYPLLLLDMVFYEFIGLLSSILADLSYTILDPRMRVGSGKLS
jgi:peptide/nickel transport system permease protein/oligopeptide transport system permease protein